MKNFKIPQLFLVLIIALNVAACTIQPRVTTSTSSVFPTTGPAHIRILLEHSPKGTADLMWDPMSNELSVTIAVTGLAPRSIHLAHIHAGNCTAMGQIVYPLNPLVADAHGVGFSKTTIHGVMNGIVSHRWAVNIHNGSTFATALDARSIACGNISTMQMVTSGVQLAHAILTATMSPDENVHGMALFRIMDSTIIITLSLSGLAPNTTHMAHIHSGSCALQGPVLYPLQPVVADAQGNVMTVTTIRVSTRPPSQWYINVHEAGTMAAMMTPQGFTPIACGDINIH